MKTLTSEAVVAGHICLDVIPAFYSGDALPNPGQLSLVGPPILSPGGPVSNTGLALHHLGIETQLMGKVGDDVFGKVVVDLIKYRDPKLAEGIIKAPGETTSYTVVLSLPNRDRSFLHCPGANDTFRSADLKTDRISHTRLFHFGYPPLMAQMYAKDGLELAEIFRKVKHLGVSTSLDMVMIDPHSPAGRANWEAILQTVLPYVDMFLPSIEEILLLLGRPVDKDLWVEQSSQGDRLRITFVREIADLLLGWGTKIVVLKMGQLGIYMRTAKLECLTDFGAATPSNLAAWANRELWSPIFQIDRFGGTTGAGDSAIAGFFAALLKDKSPEETLMFACATGACNVEAPDALSGLKTWDETWARITKGWARIPLNFDEPGWKLDSSTQVWLSPIDNKN
jgi:sugar/nucleoside kinase (ribokinase family)